MLRTSSIFPALALACVSALAFAPSSSAQQLRVALCGAAAQTETGCQWTDVRSRLLATQRFAAVDILSVVASTPTLAELLPYDALLCWTNSTPLDNAAWGDVLSHYVDAGGGVVVAVYANSTTTAGRNIGGRWQNGYEVIRDRSGNTSGAGGALGTVLVPSHPVMNGVSAFTGGTSGARPLGTALQSGSTLIAEWNDGSVLAAVGTNPRRIDLGFYPPHASCSQSGWSTGGDLLMVNALRYVASFPRFFPYGAGCPGMQGVPGLAPQGNAVPALGAAFALNVSHLPFGTGSLVIGTSDTAFGPLALPMNLGALGMSGCSLLTDLDLSVPFSGGTSATIPMPIPNDGALLWAVAYAQAFVVDPSANAVGLTVSNGARIRIGR